MLALRIALLTLFLILFSQSSHAGCTSSSLVITPSLSSISIPPGTVDGDIVWSGTFKVTANGCTIGAATPAGSWIAIPFGTTAKTLAGIPGLKIRATGGPNSPSGCSGGYDSGTTSMWNGAGQRVAFFAHPINTTCGTMTATFPVQIVAMPSNGSMNGTLAANKLVASAGGGPGGTTDWAGWADSGAPTTGINAPNSVTVTSANCTVSVTSMTVTLPNVGKSLLGSPGNTAGITAFPISLAGCTALGSSYVAQASWTFTQGAASDQIKNTGSATNVVVQILDSAFSPITNGGTSTLANVGNSGGNYTSTYYARYYSNGVGGPGSVSSLAAFNLTYQ